MDQVVDITMMLYPEWAFPERQRMLTYRVHLSAKKPCVSLAYHTAYYCCYYEQPVVYLRL